MPINHKCRPNINAGRSNAYPGAALTNSVLYHLRAGTRKDFSILQTRLLLLL